LSTDRVGVDTALHVGAGGARNRDVAMLGGYQSMEVDFVADQPGLSLLHCHQQIHMDYRLMTLLNTT
jgi:FtsP/CotA-like multicopper oxidase with cupredoxin domain